MSTAYRIPSESMLELVERLAKLNKLSAKLGSTPITLEVIAEVHSPITEKDDETGEWVERGIAVDSVVVVTGEPPKLADWELLATLQHEEAGNIIRWAPAGQSADQEARSLWTAVYGVGAPYCDYCKKARRRNDTYLVQHTETKQIRSIGSNCLRDFLGHTDPKRIIALIEMMGTLYRDMETLDRDGYSGRRQSHTTTQEYLTHVAAIIRTEGYVSRAKSAEWDRTATSDAAASNMEDARARRRDKYGNQRWTDTTEDDATLAETVIAWARGLDTAGNDFLHNLKVALSGEFIQSRSYGIAAAGIASYQREQAKKLEAEREKAEPKPVSEWQGLVAEHIERDVTVTRIYDWQADGGWRAVSTRLHTMEDDAGNVYVWGASSERMEVGERVHIRGTVKDHSEYRGVRQTRLTRCTVTNLEPRAV